MEKDAIQSDWKLHGLYYAAQISGSVIPLLVAAAVYYGAEYFPYVTNPPFLSALMVLIAVTHFCLFVFGEVFRRKVFFTVSRWVWVAFWLATVWGSGGVESQFIFLLLFPLLVSVVDLEEESTKRVAFVTIALFGSFALFDPVTLGDPARLAMHLLRTFLLIVIAYYLFRIVRGTLRQRYEKEEAKRKFAELIELDRVKTDFITVVSHQLRTPLSGIRWALSNLKEAGELAAQTRTLVEKSEEYVNRALGIVNELISTSEARVPRLLFKKKPTELSSLIREVVGELGFLAKQKRVSVQTGSFGGARVPADRRTLKAALTNILDNAIRYAPRGAVEIEGKRGADGQYLIAIADTGIGIAPEDLSRVGDRFYRGKNALSLEPNETGVGLYIAKQIIERHGGTLSVDSTPGKGTRVTVALPSAGVL